MENFDKPEGQTTSDNFLTSEIEKDFLRSQSGWGDISPEEQGYVGKKGFKTPAELLKSYRELEKAYSSKISLPKDGDKDAFDKLYSRLGMPQDSSGFDIDFAEVDKEDGEKFKQVCLENNILPQAAKALYDWFVKNRDEAMESYSAQWQENSDREMKELQQAWGAQAPRNMELMKRGIRLFAEEPEVVEAIEQAIGTKRLMETFYRLGDAISEDNPVSFGKKAAKDGSWSAVEYFREMFNDYS